MSRIGGTRILVAVLALLAYASIPATEATAKKKSRIVQSQARWVAFDTAEATVTVKIVKAGKIADKQQKKQVRKGKEVVFDVKPEGSVLTRTTVAINGMKADLAEIEVGRSVRIYWVSDESKPHGRFARKIDVVFTRKELEERYGVQDE